MFGDNGLKCSKCYDRKAKVAFRTSKCCDPEGRSKGKTPKNGLDSGLNSGLDSLFKEVRLFKGLLACRKRSPQKESGKKVCGKKVTEKVTEAS